ncbi:hypothetical protein BC628DRAFT_1411921 [Trametes gibbosa]|nr:hypothetical protein BC628DRAFT_1411921 [Trametes gibbosa]
MGPDCPWWVYIADDIFAWCLRTNPFLQNWKLIKMNLPDGLKSILAVAKQHGLQLEVLAPERTILRKMPMWDHAKADKTKIWTLGGHSAATACLKNIHQLVTVGDFKHFAMGESEPRHDQTSGACKCDQCTYMWLDIGCAEPLECYAQAMVFLNTLPLKWDPSGEQPEDYEAMGMQEVYLLFAGQVLGPVTTMRTITDVLQIFTGPEKVCNDLPNLAVSNESCLDNEMASAKAGANIFFAEGHPCNRSIQLPPNMEQLNQTGEAVATLTVAQAADPVALLLHIMDS